MEYDAIVIGGSFAGLSAAMQIARAGRRVCVIDAGQPRNRFAATSHGFFGRDGVPPQQMIAEARAKLAVYPAVTLIDGLAVDAHPEGRGFVVSLADDRRKTATKLILAFGLVDILPDIPGLADRWGRTVLHCPYCHGYEFRQEKLGVLSVMPMSPHQALLIADWGPTTLFLNGGEPPDAATRASLARQGVPIEPARVRQLEGEGTDLAGLRLEDGRFVELAALYLVSSTRMASPIAEQLGCAFDEGMNGLLIRTDAMKATTVPGVYAAGDIARMAPNASWASADGVMAGVALHRALVFEPLEAAEA